MHIAHAFDPLPTVNTRNIFAFLMELNHIFEHTPLFLEDKIFILVQIKNKEDINYYFIFQAKMFVYLNLLWKSEAKSLTLCEIKGM